MLGLLTCWFKLHFWCLNSLWKTRFFWWRWRPSDDSWSGDRSSHAPGQIGASAGCALRNHGEDGEDCDDLWKHVETWVGDAWWICFFTCSPIATGIMGWDGIFQGSISPEGIRKWEVLPIGWCRLRDVESKTHALLPSSLDRWTLTHEFAEGGPPSAPSI